MFKCEKTIIFTELRIPNIHDFLDKFYYLAYQQREIFNGKSTLH